MEAAVHAGDDEVDGDIHMSDDGGDNDGATAAVTQKGEGRDDDSEGDAATEAALLQLMSKMKKKKKKRKKKSLALGQRGTGNSNLSVPTTASTPEHKENEASTSAPVSAEADQATTAKATPPPSTRGSRHQQEEEKRDGAVDKDKAEKSSPSQNLHPTSPRTPIPAAAPPLAASAIAPRAGRAKRGSRRKKAGVAISGPVVAAMNSVAADHGSDDGLGHAADDGDGNGETYEDGEHREPLSHEDKSIFNALQALQRAKEGKKKKKAAKGKKIMKGQEFGPASTKTAPLAEAGSKSLAVSTQQQQQQQQHSGQSTKLAQPSAQDVVGTEVMAPATSTLIGQAMPTPQQQAVVASSSTARSRTRSGGKRTVSYAELDARAFDHALGIRTRDEDGGDGTVPSTQPASLDGIGDDAALQETPAAMKGKRSHTLSASAKPIQPRKRRKAAGKRKPRKKSGGPADTVLDGVSGAIVPLGPNELALPAEEALKAIKLSTPLREARKLVPRPSSDSSNNVTMASYCYYNPINPIVEKKKEAVSSTPIDGASLLPSANNAQSSSKEGETPGKPRASNEEGESSTSSSSPSGKNGREGEAQPTQYVEFINGKLVVRQSALEQQIQLKPQPTEMSTAQVLEYTNSASYTNRRQVKPWSEEESELFFEGLSYCGTDFSTLQRIFPSRERRDVKRKYERELRTNEDLVFAALDNHLPLTEEWIVLASQRAAEAEEKREKAKKKKKNASRRKGNKKQLQH